jgi:hypothetical protein
LPGAYSVATGPPAEVPATKIRGEALARYVNQQTGGLPIASGCAFRRASWPLCPCALQSK